MAGPVKPDWLDGWTRTRRLSQQELAKRWSKRQDRKENLTTNDPLEAKQEKSKPLPLLHTKMILLHGKKSYRRWVLAGCPEGYEWS